MSPKNPKTTTDYRHKMMPKDFDPSEVPEPSVYQDLQTHLGRWFSVQIPVGKTPHTVTTRFHAAARTRGLKANTKTKGTTVYVRWYESEPEPHPGSPIIADSDDIEYLQDPNRAFGHEHLRPQVTG